MSRTATVIISPSFTWALPVAARCVTTGPNAPVPCDSSSTGKFRFTDPGRQALGNVAGPPVSGAALAKPYGFSDTIALRAQHQRFPGSELRRQVSECGQGHRERLDSHARWRPAGGAHLDA